MIAASVWMAPAIWNAVRPEIERSTAETTPTESDWRSENGEPIAATGVPTSTSAERPSGSGRYECGARPERTVRNPSTGEQMKKPADRVAKVTIAKQLKDVINA